MRHAEPPRVDRRHVDRAHRVMRAMSRAWAAVLQHDHAEAVACLAGAVQEFEGDHGFARLNVDVLETVAEAVEHFRLAAAAHGSLVGQAVDVLERITVLEVRLRGPVK